MENREEGIQALKLLIELVYENQNNLQDYEIYNTILCNLAYDLIVESEVFHTEEA